MWHETEIKHRNNSEMFYICFRVVSGHAYDDYFNVFFHMCEALKQNWNKTPVVGGGLKVLFQFYFMCSHMWNKTEIKTETKQLCFSFLKFYSHVWSA